MDLFLSRGYLWHAVERFLYRIPVVAASNYYSIFLQATTDVTNWPSLNEAPPPAPATTTSVTNSIVANKSKPGTTSKSETSSINGENESSQGEQHQVDGGKENKQDTGKNKKKKGKLSSIFLLKSGNQVYRFQFLALGSTLWSKSIAKTTVGCLDQDGQYRSLIELF